MRTRRLAPVALAPLAALAGVPIASAQVTQGTIAIDLEPVASGLVAPIYATHAGDNSGRLFIVDQTGKILILQNGQVLATPFLDLTSEIVAVNLGFDERGVLGLAFHPNYATNGRFFVRYSKPRVGVSGEPCFGTGRGCHEEILAEYSVSANPNVANPTETILFRVNEPEFNHNGGQVEFGPDGFLYFSLGDGGGANDGLSSPSLPHGPIGNGQNINVPLGKVLRIDVNGAPPYAIPPTNPFVGGPGLDEIWAYGLRNPYRFSFDSRPGGDGRMWLSDVGQNLYEEINIGQMGANYGWVIKEGPICFDPQNPGTPLPSCNDTGMTPPVAYYGRSDGISIIGGFVYRGAAVPALVGKYITGDFSLSFASPQGRLFYLDTALASPTFRTLQIGPDNRVLGKFVKGFGQDQSGEVYAMVGSAGGPSGTTGQVLRFVKCYANCDDSTQAPILNVADFGCFLARYAAGDPGANCDLSVTPPVLNVSDFGCFLTRYAAGCP
ncbi:MAG: PQQ-dependent sugar dehydrogenase [Phycisphaerales bacterium]